MLFRDYLCVIRYIVDWLFSVCVSVLSILFLCFVVVNFVLNIALYQLLEMILCRGFEYGSLWECYADEFGDWFPVFYGLGCGEHSMSVRMCNTENGLDGFHCSGYLSNSASNYKYLQSPLMSLHCPDTSETHLAVRTAVFEWFYSLTRRNSQFEKQVFDEIGSLYDKDFVYENTDDGLTLNREKFQHVLNDLFFYFTLGGRLQEKELEYLDILTTSKAGLAFVSGSLTKAMAFTLMGNLYSRKFLEIMHVLGYAFYRQKNSRAMKNAFKAAKKGGIDEWSIIRAFAQFYVPNSMGVVHTAMDTIKFLQSDPEKYVEMYNEDPQAFINEVLRIRSPLQFINSFAYIEPKQAEICGKTYHFPAMTPFTILLSMANQDSNVFGGDSNSKDYAHTFDPRRRNLDENVTFRGVYDKLGSTTQFERGTRYCPGYQMVMKKFVPYLVKKFAKFGDKHKDLEKSLVDGVKPYNKDFDKRKYGDYVVNGRKTEELKKQLTVAKLLHENYVLLHNTKCKHFFGSLNEPVTNEYTVNSIELHRSHVAKYRKNLDFHTSVLVNLVLKASDKWNANPPTAKDIQYPQSDTCLPKEPLPFGVQLPTIDEDNTVPMKYMIKLARALLSSPDLACKDNCAEWSSIEEAIGFRNNIFGKRLPPANVVYKELHSDESMTILSFFAGGSHTVSVIKKELESDYDVKESVEETKIGLSAEMRRRSMNGMNGNIGDLFAPDDAYYMNDVTFLGMFDVRDGYNKYGACLYFDKKFQLIAIYTCWNNKLTMKPENSTFDQNNITEWDYCKWAFKCTFSAVLTLCGHALKTHMIEANAFVVSVRESLPKHHPLRIFLKPYVFRTVSINNQAANSLIKEHAIFDRLYCFKRESFVDMLKYCILNYKFKPARNNYCHPSMMSENISERDFPFKYDLASLWDITYKYLSGWFDLYYPTFDDDDGNGNTDRAPIEEIYNNETNDGKSVQLFVMNLKKLLGFEEPCTRGDVLNIICHLIVNACGIHEHVGQVSDYLMNPMFIGSRIRKLPESGELKLKHVMMTVQEFAQSLALTTLTGLKMPKLLQDWSHLIKDKAHLEIYTQYKQELEQLSKHIDRKNGDTSLRRYPFQSFNPKHLETSVSV